MPSTPNTTKHHAAGAGQRRGTMPSSILSSRASVAALLTVAAFSVLLFVLRPGYWINDDVKIVWSLAGYPGGTGVQPFLVHNNVLLGLALAPLYGLRTSANWYVVLLVLLNALPTGGLLWLILAARRNMLLTITACAAILIGVAALTINVTYTLSSSLACFAGVALVCASARGAASRWWLTAAGGCLLLLAGAMLRLPMFFITLLLAIPFVAGSLSSLNARRLLGVSTAAGLMILFAAGFDRLYVRASPDWNAFYAYTDVREQLHDSHRLNNVHTEIRRVGWTPNDQELFAHWFYPDEQIYSFDKLKYLVDRVPPASRDVWGSAAQFVRQLGTAQQAPYLMWMVAIVAVAVAARATRRTVAVLVLIWAFALGANLVLTVIYKDPDYVLAGTLAGSTALSLVFLLWSTRQPVDPTSAPRRQPEPTTFLIQLSFVLAVLGGVALLANLVSRSSLNIARQRDYSRFRSDLEALQQDGALASDALIVSPAHGLPYEWAYPLTVDLPSPPYFDTGWITFSPPYRRVLNEYGITSLPEALVSKDNLYLMAESSFTRFLSRYYEERGGPPVIFKSLYELPVSAGLLGDDPIHLYKLSMRP